MMEFSNKDTCTEWNGIFTGTGIRKVLKGKDYRNMNSVFSFLTESIKLATGCIAKTSMTEVY